MASIAIDLPAVVASPPPVAVAEEKKAAVAAVAIGVCDEDHELKDQISLAIGKELMAEVKDGLAWRYRWRNIANGSMGMAKVFLMFNAVACFAAGYFSLAWLSFVAGCLVVVATALERFASFSNDNSHRRTVEANQLLLHLGMKEALPNFQEPSRRPTRASGARRGPSHGSGLEMT